jgi:rhamnosyltransferase
LSTLSETHLPVDTVLDRTRTRAHVAIVIPTCNARRDWTPLSTGIRLQGLPPSQVLIIDSSSTDGTPELAAAEGYRVIRIDRSNFNHGGTRQLAIELIPWASIVVYLTQDAVLATSDSLDRLLAAFTGEKVGAAYGRQLPRLAAGAIEAHARLFNYPPDAHVCDLESRHTLGIKAAFLSNSFAAYCISALLEAGGFPSDTIMAEDALVAGKLLLAGWKIAYVAEAQVYHSHPFTIAEEFHRYFDTGVYHRREAWLIDKFGKPTGEGKRFVLSQLAFLARRNPLLLPAAAVRTAAKALGYQLGLREAKLGKRWSRRLSLHKSFWDSSASSH